MPPSDDVPRVDPDNRKGKLEIAWVVGIAIVVAIAAFIVWGLSPRKLPAQKGIVGPNAAAPVALKPEGQPNSLVPAH